jgi:plastocyanin
MIGLLATAVLGVGAATYDVATTPANTYSPQGLRVAPGDTVRWAASGTHPLVFDGEAGGPYTSTQERTLNDPVQLRFHCNVHGGPGGAGMSGVVTVGAINAAPAIAVQRETAAPAAGAPVAFRATASDPERLALRIDWDMDGDGTFERVNAGTQASATYAAGTRTVTARAIDDLGLTATAAHTFTVPATEPAPAAPPPGDPPAGDGPAAPDTLAPTVGVSAPRAIAARRLRRRGVRMVLTPSEDGRLVVVLRNRAGRRLARATAEAHADRAATLRLRPRRVRAGRLVLRIAAIDRAGNRTTVTRRLRVRAG